MRFQGHQILGQGRVLVARDESLFGPVEPLDSTEAQQLMIESYQDWFTIYVKGDHVT